MDYLGVVSEEPLHLNAFDVLPSEVMYFALQVNCTPPCYHDVNDVFRCLLCWPLGFG